MAKRAEPNTDGASVERAEPITEGASVERAEPITEGASVERAKLLEVDGLSVTFGSGRKAFKAVDNVSFHIYQGETLGLVGESGSGKTTIGRAILRINPLSNGEVRFMGERISGKLSKKRDREIIQQIQMIFQDPMSSLNERAKVDYIVSEGLLNLPEKLSESERLQKIHSALLEVGLLPEFSSRFPHEFSGGQRQRIGIARALVMQPRLIVADEPISALDVSIRAQVLNLMNRLKKSLGLTYLFIAHDLSIVRFITDRVAVIHKGKIVELADTETLYTQPLHPYTRSLLSAIPMPDPGYERHREILTYTPSPQDPDDPQAWTEITPGHFVLANQRELAQYRQELAQYRQELAQYRQEASLVAEVVL